MDIQGKTDADGKTLMDKALELDKKLQDDRWVKALNDYNFDLCWFIYKKENRIYN